jgi:hypothetical protein
MQGGECNYEFGGISESRIKKTPDAFPHPVGKLLRGSAHPAGERQDG